MIAVYFNCWTANPAVVAQRGEPIFYVRSEADVQRMFAINPTWRIKEQRIRALADVAVPVVDVQAVEIVRDNDAIFDTQALAALRNGALINAYCA